MVVVENANGTVQFEDFEIIMFIEEQVKLVPGVLFFRKNDPFKFLREKLNMTTGKVQINQISPNEITVTMSILMKKEMNYNNIEEEISSLLNYSLKKQFGISINYIEINIENLI